MASVFDVRSAPEEQSMNKASAEAIHPNLPGLRRCFASRNNGPQKADYLAGLIYRAYIPHFQMHSVYLH